MLLLLFALSYFSVKHSDPKLSIFLAMDFGTRSHVKYLFEISTKLKENGHEIYYVAPDEQIDFARGYNLTFLDLGTPTFSKKDVKIAMHAQNSKPYDFGVTLEELGGKFSLTYTERFLKMKSLIQDHRPDLVICDFFFVPCFDAVRYMNVPMMISTPGVDLIPTSSAPYINPFPNLEPSTTEFMNIFERLKIMATKIKFIFKLSSVVSELNSRRKENGVPPSGLLGDWVNAFKIVNNFMGYDDPRPLEPSINLVGPIISDEERELDLSTSNFLNNNKRVVYVAQGSINVIPETHLENVLSALFMALDENLIDGVIWASGFMESTDFPETITVRGTVHKVRSEIKSENNFLLKKWLPQTKVLHHNNTKLFLSHGGLESIFESIYYLKPILATPYFGDQHRNAMKIKEKNIGDFVDLRQALPLQILEKIKLLILDNDEMRLSLQHMRILIKYNSRRISYAKDMIEMYAYSARACRDGVYRKNELQPCELFPYMPPSTRMSFIKIYSLDIFGMIGISILVLAYLINRGLRSPKRNLKKKND